MMYFLAASTAHAHARWLYWANTLAYAARVINAPLAPGLGESRMRGIFVAAAICAALSGAVQAQTEWLSGMPTAKQVESAMQGRNERDTAAQTSAALQMMDGVVQSLSPKPFDPARLTPEVRRRLDEYRAARERIDAREMGKFSGSRCEGDQCEKYLYPRCAQKYAFSPEFYRVVMDRHFTPDWQRSWVPRVHGTLWQRALKLPAGTPLPAGFADGPPCAGAGAGEPGLLDYATAGADIGRDVLAGLLVGDVRTYRTPRVLFDDVLPGLLLAAAAAAVLIVLALRQTLRNVTLDRSNARKLVSSVPYELDLFAGDLQGYSRGIETITTVSGGQNNTPVTSSSRSVLHERFFLVGPVGGEVEVKLTDADSGARDGHRMTAAWIQKPGATGGPWLFMRNHTMRTTMWFGNNAKKPYGLRSWPVWGLVALFFGTCIWVGMRADTLRVVRDGWDVTGHLVLWFGLPALLVVASLFMWIYAARSRRLARFRREVDERLIPELDRAAGV